MRPSASRRNRDHAALVSFNLRCPVHQRRCKCSVRRDRNPPQVERNPISNDDRLRNHFLSTTAAISEGEEWIGFVIPRIGHADGLDHAAQAMVKAYGQPDPVFLRGSAEYCQSLQALQLACQTNKVSSYDLLTVTMCFMYEVRATATGAEPHIHGNGIGAMITSRKPQEWKDDVATAIFYALGTLVFHNSVLQGKRSPFDTGEWIFVEPTKSFSPIACVRRLRYLAQVLLIELPYLIQLVRECSGLSPSMQSDLSARLCDLLDTYDRETERQVLERLDLGPTRNLSVARYYQLSYSFPDHAHFQASVVWWTARLILLRLCTKIMYSNSQFSQLQLEGEQRRLCDHLLMSLSHTENLNPVTRWPYLLAIQPLFGALGELSFDKGKSEHLQSTLESWYIWFLRSLNMPQQQPDVLRYLSNVLRGGPLGPAT